MLNPQQVLKGKFYRIEKQAGIEQGGQETWGGQVLGFKFSGVKALDEALAFALQKWDEQTPENLARMAERNNKDKERADKATQALNKANKTIAGLQQRIYCLELELGGRKRQGLKPPLKGGRLKHEN